MTTASTGWKAAFSAFLDRRALIMLFLGFSAGIPILLIFSSLSLWLGEAGIEKSAITFFSWAALGYSFKFVWAPLIDELPVPFLTRKLGRRRAWLLIAQLLIIVAIFIMAYSDPSLGQSYLYQMAFGAVLLGFSAATQDIVIDAYRIELADTQMQTILASTYNAGYRIGMIIAGAGALFLAAYLGTSKGNYIYQAWKLTYLAMAAVMLVGVVTTLIVREPQVERIRKSYRKVDYYRLVLVFFITVLGFVGSYISADQLILYVKTTVEISDALTLFALEAVRFIGSGIVALCIGILLVKIGVVNKQMAYDTWVNPIADFFRRYGVKLALVLLLLIGFYRISDIISGVISNVFYQDLNFTKEQIAEAVKVYGVIFSLLGGFLGGLLAQRMNIMKLMFVGAILASMTNLIFIGLVKSGTPLGDVTVQVGNQHYVAHPDEVGLWSIQIPSQVFTQSDHIQVGVQYQNQPASLRSFTLPYLLAQKQPQILLLPIASDDHLSPQELKQGVVIRGQLAGIDQQQLDPEKPVVLTLDGQTFVAKLDTKQIFSAVIDADALQRSASKEIIATVTLIPQNKVLKTQRSYQFSSGKPELGVDLHEIPPVSLDMKNIEIQGKVIKSYSSTWLYFAIVVDNLAAGLAGAAFIAFLSSLTSVSFTAVQYAIFSSLMTLTPKILGGYSGTIVTKIGYPDFFLMTTLIGIPILFLVIWVAKLLKQHQQS
ncbi:MULTISPECIES: AmpG family muropeptide MFS transporter [unclassified Acinetobacter]|uniref:AmpG family muropeptide MFS transporter n=1 Tax=unclassified Acinetobacter TaxID=196816 RepID=UPI002934FDAB|nr:MULTISPECIES: MFS transporter [unclassified Acinetobacter]WOE32649.1 MFS transporter [Acinetobacter sp. SAAs470]WOE38125.1 MFS transporter [Acinetobacter sp. SAAs474]